MLSWEWSYLIFTTSNMTSMFDPTNIKYLSTCCNWDDKLLRQFDGGGTFFSCCAWQNQSKPVKLTLDGAAWLLVACVLRAPSQAFTMSVRPLRLLPGGELVSGPLAAHWTHLPQPHAALAPVLQRLQDPAGCERRHVVEDQRQQGHCHRRRHQPLHGHATAKPRHLASCFRTPVGVLPFAARPLLRPGGTLGPLAPGHRLLLHLLQLLASSVPALDGGGSLTGAVLATFDLR